MYKEEYTESAELFDVFKIESNLFDDDVSPIPVESNKRALNGKKEYTNMRHVWTDEEVKKLLSVYAKQHGHIGMWCLS